MGSRAARALVASLGFALTACGGAAAPERIVIVTLDTTRADRLGFYGYADAATPNLDALAAEASVFDHAVSPVPTTLPAHACLFTGTYPQDHGVRYNLTFRLGDGAVTLAERLRAAGFATAAFPAAYVVRSEYGLSQGFDSWRQPPAAPAEGGGPDALNGVRAAEGVDGAIAWLDAHRSGPAFVWLHVYDPHAPYAPPFPWSSRFEGRAYDGEIAYTDHELGRLFDRLRGDPAWDRTMLIVVGDHGEGLHDHGERQHSSLIYESTQHIPFVVRVPGGRGRRIEEPVSLVDVVPTVLDYVDVRTADPLRGVSLRRAIDDGTEPPRRDVYMESLSGSLNYGWQELRGIRDGRWKLVDSAEPELFDLESDPGETRNLASFEEARLGEMREALGEIAEPLSGAAAAESAHEPVLDDQTRDLLVSLGYVAGGSGGSAAEAPNPRDLIDLEGELLNAQTAVATKRWDVLEELCRYVLTRDPTNKMAFHNLSRALMETGRPREAQDVAKEAIEAYPGEEFPYLLLAESLQAQGRTEDALAAIERGLAGHPDSATLTYYRLVASFDLRRPVCPDEVQRAVDAFPGSPTLRVLEARCEARAGNAETALATLRLATQQGFRQLSILEQAEDFADVVKLPGFAELAASLESPGSETGAPDGAAR